jgi:hypothetical protein
MFHAWNNLMISYVLSEPQGQVNTTDLETSVSDSSFLILRCDKEPPDDLYQYTDGQQPPSFESTDWFKGKILTRNKRKNVTGNHGFSHVSYGAVPVSIFPETNPLMEEIPSGYD